jgi:ribosomal protein L11 methyltransferase
LLKVSVSTMVEAEEAVAVLMERLFRQAPTLYTDEATLVTEASVYCASASAWTPARQAKLRAGLRQIRAQGLAVGPTRIRVRSLCARDWAESWKKHFRPIAVGHALLVKPSWSRRRALAGQAVVVLDPGLSFGTGQHPTTCFCLSQLAALRVPGQALSLLDIGTGSGILAIAAAKLGYDPVRAFDMDPAALRTARANARVNGVASRIHFSRADLALLPASCEARYDVICANLLAELLVAQAPKIVSWLRPGGRVLLAGILTTQFPLAQSTYEQAGLKLAFAKADKEWKSGLFVLPGEPSG